MTKEFIGHTAVVNAALFLSDETLLVSGSSDGSVRLWSVKSCECLRTFKVSLVSSKLFVILIKYKLVYSLLFVYELIVI